MYARCELTQVCRGMSRYNKKINYTLFWCKFIHFLKKPQTISNIFKSEGTLLILILVS